jgi:hypothetical protein
VAKLISKKSQSEKGKRTQWRISTLLILMLGFGILFGGIVNIRSAVELEVTFQSLPANDEALEDWIRKTYRPGKLSIARGEGNKVAMQFTRAIYALEIPQPPWPAMNYGPVNSFVFSQSAVVGWWIPAGLVLIFLAGPLSRLLHYLGSRVALSKDATVQEPIGS